MSIADSVVTNRAGGTLIDAAPGRAVNVTLNRVVAVGGGSFETSGRFFIGYDFESVAIKNCSIESTRGIELSHGIAGSSVLITRNRHTNIQGNTLRPVGNFVQLRAVQNSAIEISWNEVLNTYNRSNPTDLVNIYKSAHARVHDNYFGHQSLPGNAYNASSQNGITIEEGEGGAPESFDNEIWRNQLVDGEGIGIFDGHHNFVHHNHIIQDGYLPDGVTRIGSGYEPLWVGGDGHNNRVRFNVVGFVNRDGVRQRGRFPGAPGEHRLNVPINGPVTRATERAQWRAWLAKLRKRNIRVGAGDVPVERADQPR